MPVHLFGHVMDVDAIQARAPGVPILEDAAQAIGATDAEGPPRRDDRRDRRVLVLSDEEPRGRGRRRHGGHARRRRCSTR